MVPPLLAAPWNTAPEPPAAPWHAAPRTLAGKPLRRGSGSQPSSAGSTGSTQRALCCAAEALNLFSLHFLWQEKSNPAFLKCGFQVAFQEPSVWPPPWLVLYQGNSGACPWGLMVVTALLGPEVFPGGLQLPTYLLELAQFGGTGIEPGMFACRAQTLSLSPGVLKFKVTFLGSSSVEREGSARGSVAPSCLAVPRIFRPGPDAVSRMHQGLSPCGPCQRSLSKPQPCPSWVPGGGSSCPQP